jgi:prepilin-type N-terminal cleavage/methylation domain-containing protein
MKKGFTIIEITVVMAVVCILASLSLPNLLRAKANANQAAAVTTLNLIVRAVIAYSAANPVVGCPASLADLANVTPAYLNDPRLAAGRGENATRQGYYFLYVLDYAGPPATRFHVFSYPVKPGATGTNSYYCDESGIIYYQSNGTCFDPAPEGVEPTGTPPRGGGGLWYVIQ